MMERTQTNGEHREYYSYALCVRLRRMGNFVVYISSYSVDDYAYISKINEYTLTKYAQNIYIRKQVRYYDNDSIFIVKPNQKRFWIRSQAFYDAGTIINEIAVNKDGNFGD